MYLFECIFNTTVDNIIWYDKNTGCHNNFLIVLPETMIQQLKRKALQHSSINIKIYKIKLHYIFSMYTKYPI